MRRIAFLTAVGVMLFAGIAYAVTNTMNYTATVKKGAGKPSAKKPVPIKYTGTLTVDTNPPGQEPDVAPTTTVYFAKNLKQNAKLFPSCTQAQIEDGTNTFPAKCKSATVGTGTATALAGNPGDAPGVTETLNVAAINGPKGKIIWLAVHSTPDAPVALPNRVIPGTLAAASSPYGYTVRFDIPADLQNQLGLSIALSKFSVTISNRTITKKTHGVKQKFSYLMMVAPCVGGKMPTKAITIFKAQDGTQTPVTSESTASC